MKRDTEEGKNNDEQFMNEVEALSQVDHPHILKLIDWSNHYTVTTTSNKIVDVNWLVLEYAENGEMFDYIAKSGSFAEATARYYFWQLLSAISHMNIKGFSHSDIKPENIMLDSEFNLKLADFGFATQNEFSSSQTGTLSYMAPEKLSKLKYKTKECDLFSAAVILFMMVMQHWPFNRADPTDEYYSHIILEDYEEFWEVHQNYNGQEIVVSDEFKDLFVNMVTVSPVNRLSLKQIMKHKWTQGYMPTHQEIYENFSYRKLVLEGRIEGSTNSSGEMIESKSNTPEDKRNEKKYTRYYNWTHGEIMVNWVWKFAEEFGLKYKTNDDYYRVNLKAKMGTKKATIQVNILRRPKVDLRCFEWIRLEGSYTVFLEIFSHFKRYMIESRKILEVK